MFLGIKDDFQSALREALGDDPNNGCGGHCTASLSVSMFVSLTPFSTTDPSLSRSSVVENEPQSNRLPYLWDILNSFTNSFFQLYSYNVVSRGISINRASHP